MVEATAKEVAGGAGLYVIRCTVNGKVYVGCTGRSLLDRMNQHFHHLRNKTHHTPRLQADYDLYGDAAFEFHVLRQITDGTHFIAESEEIERRKATDPEFGYNNGPVPRNEKPRQRAPGAGRKPTRGVKKIDWNVALTPDVRAFLKALGPTVGEAIERIARERPEFADFQKSC